MENTTKTSENKDKAPLHIYIETNPGQVFHKDIGWLELKKAESFNVYIKEYKDRKDVLDQQKEKDLNAAKKNHAKKISEVEKEEKDSYDFILKNYNDYNAGKVKAETYDANVKKRDEGIAAREKRRKKINNDNSEAVKGINKKYDDDLAVITADYGSVRWVQQLIGDRRPELTAESFNESVIMGTAAMKFTFDEFLEGGGAVYLEPFWSGTKPQGKYPHGVIINAKGESPDVMLAQWEDADNNVITKTLKFGSSVYLNVYTSALYGNNIKVQLKDKDKVIRLITLGLTNADDNLYAVEYLNNNAEERTDEDISKQGTYFERAVSVHEAKKAPSNAKKGLLVEEDGNKYDGIPKTKINIQKSQFVVFIDPLWQTMGGESLEIYPVVYHNKIPGGKKVLQECLLKIDKNATDEIKVDSSNSNQVVVLSQVETNIQHFSPCGYDTITAFLDITEYPVFARKTSEIESELLLEIITADKEKNLYIYLPDLKTKECTYNNIIEYHTGKVITLKDPESHYKKLKKTDDDISFDVSYPKPSAQLAMDYAWLPSAKPINYGLQFTSCRFQHPLTIKVYPELEYTFNAHLGVDESEYLYVTQTKNYKKRDYKGKKKDGSKAAKKDHNKRIKENFKEDVDNQVKKDNFREKYKVSIGAEYKFGEGDPTTIELTTLKTLQDIIENIMYMYDTIDSYLQGDQMKQIEEGEKFDENGNKIPQTPAQKARNKAEYEAKKQQRQDKKKKNMPQTKDSPASSSGSKNVKRPKGGGFPVRLEVTPPKFTGGVTWSYKQSQKKPNLVGVNYQFKFGALPLVGVTGRLDLLFVAQFIPYVGQVVKGLDKAVAAVNKVGDVLSFLKLGTLEAEYYFDLVATTQLDIDVIKGMAYHTIDGFTGGHLQIESPLSISLEAGGSIKAQFLDVKGEASISASATAKFKIYYVSDKKEFLTFEFEGVEGIVKTKFVLKQEKEDEEENEPEEAEKDPEPVPILSGFKIEIPLFKMQIVENPHKDEK